LFDNNLISTTVANSNLNLARTTAANIVDIFDIELKENNISNSSNNLLKLASTGDGYVKFDTTTGLVIPFGNNAARTSTPQVGETRYNNEDSEASFLEIYSGAAWERAAGAGGEVTLDYLDEINNLYILVLG
jgi:hypothetical protein